MKKQFIAGIVFAVVLCAAAIWLLFQFVFLFSSANSSVQTSIIAGAVALISVIATIWRERSKAIKEAHREKKIEIYNQFVDVIFEFVKNPNKSEEMGEIRRDSPLAIKLLEVSRGALLYGSPKVVLAISDWKKSGKKIDPSPLSTFDAMGRILLAMREDIGLSNWGLTNINIHQLYVIDDLSKFGKPQ